MPPRAVADFAALFESLVEDLRIQVAASVDRTLADFSRRLARIERRLDRLDASESTGDEAAPVRCCSLCERPAMARGFCSAHYQQWRYRDRKNKSTRPPTTRVATRLVLAPLPEVRGNDYVAAALEENPTLALAPLPTMDCKQRPV